MPQAQILQAPATFGDRLAQAIPQAAGSLLGGVTDQFALEALGQAQSPLQQFIAFGRLTPERQKSMGTAFTALQSSQASAAKEQAKLDKANQQKLDRFNEYSSITGKMRELIPYTGSTAIPGTSSFLGGSLNREAVQKRDQFRTSSISLEGLFRDLATKGQMSKNVFNTLLERLPDPNLSERENLGRLDAVDDILQAHFGGKIPGVPPPSAEQIARADQLVNQTASSEVPFGDKKIVLIDPQTKQPFYPTSKEDVEEAQRLGWEVSKSG